MFENAIGPLFFILLLVVGLFVLLGRGNKRPKLDKRHEAISDAVGKAAGSAFVNKFMK